MLKTRHVRLLAGALLLVALVAAPRGDGAGFALFEQGNRANAMAGAFVAQADDPSAMFYNPAGNAYNEKFTTYGGAFGIWRNATFSGTSPYPGDGYTADMSKALYWIGHGYAVVPLQPGNLNLAVGFWTPNGLGVPWSNPDAFAGRYISQRIDLRQVALSAQLAWKATDWLAIGGGPEFRLTDVKLGNNIGVFNPYTDRVTDVAHLSLISKGTPVKVTWNAGILIKPCDRLRFGVSYHAHVDVDVSGVAHLYQLTTGHADLDALVAQKAPMNQDLNGGTTLQFPDLLAFGVSYDLTEKLTINAAGTRQSWKVFDQTIIRIDGIAPEVIDHGWGNVYSFRAGLGYQATPSFWLGVGYVYDATPQPDYDVGPLLPDNNRVGGTIGFGFQVSKMFRVDVSSLFLWFHPRTVTTNEANFNGTYKTFAILPGISFKSTF